MKRSSRSTSGWGGWAALESSGRPMNRGAQRPCDGAPCDWVSFLPSGTGPGGIKPGLEEYRRESPSTRNAGRHRLGASCYHSCNEKVSPGARTPGLAQRHGARAQGAGSAPVDAAADRSRAYPRAVRGIACGDVPTACPTGAAGSCKPPSCGVGIRAVTTSRATGSGPGRVGPARPSGLADAAGPFGWTCSLVGPGLRAGGIASGQCGDCPVHPFQPGRYGALPFFRRDHRARRLWSLAGDARARAGSR